MFYIIICLIIFIIIAYLIDKLPDILNKTILKDKHQTKTTQRVKDCIQYNNDMIKLYSEKCTKEEYQNFYYKHCDESYSIAKIIDKDYCRKVNISEELIEEMKYSHDKALELYDVWEERRRKENITKRLEFIESELIDIKRRVIK